MLYSAATFHGLFERKADNIAREHLVIQIILNALLESLRAGDSKQRREKNKGLELNVNREPDG